MLGVMRSAGVLRAQYSNTTLPAHCTRTYHVLAFPQTKWTVATSPAMCLLCRRGRARVHRSSLLYAMRVFSLSMHSLSMSGHCRDPVRFLQHFLCTFPLHTSLVCTRAESSDWTLWRQTRRSSDAADRHHSTLSIDLTVTNTLHSRRVCTLKHTNKPLCGEQNLSGQLLR